MGMVIDNSDVMFPGLSKRERIKAVLGQFIHPSDLGEIRMTEEIYERKVQLFTDYMCQLFRGNFEEKCAPLLKDDDSLNREYDYL